MTDTRPMGNFDTLIFDLGDVLFTWSAETKTCISPKTLRKILETATWFEYEKGRIGEHECYAAVAQEMGLSADDVRAAFQGARDSLTSRPFMIDLIRELKPGRRVYAMSNISAADWEVLRTKKADWDLFDHVFTSAAAGERKPNIGFYRHVLEQTGSNPERTIFVDDKLDNVLVARSLGVTGIVYDTFTNVEQKLRNLCFDPVARGHTFLKNHAGNHLSYTSEGQTIQENFAQLLILEATGDSSLVDYVKHDGLFNFFRGEGQFTSAVFPCDADTTSIGLTCSEHLTLETKHRIMDQILTLRNEDGILQVYFDPARPRIDPVVCVNVLTLFHAYGRGHELKESFDWVQSVLQHRAYSDGTRYYEPAEAFLFFLSRLLAVSPEAQARLGPVFEARCRERIGVKADALALAMRIICCNSRGIDASVDIATLLEMQDVDGGWPDGWFYKYGSNGVRIANRGFTTALAIKAIQRSHEPPSHRGREQISKAPMSTSVNDTLLSRLANGLLWVRFRMSTSTKLGRPSNWSLGVGVGALGVGWLLGFLGSA